MEINYGEVIKTIFAQKKKTNKSVYKNKNSYSLKSITSIPSEENFSEIVKGNLKNYVIEKPNDNYNGFRIIDIDKLNDNQITENNIKTTKNDTDDYDLYLKGEELISKLKNGIKQTNNGNFEINITNNINQKKEKKNKIKINHNKATSYNFSEKNLKEIENNNIENNYLNKSSSNLVENQIKIIKKQKKPVTSLKKIKFDNIINKRNINKNQYNKFELYNTEALAYEAIKNYSHCRPKENSFLKRMEFYSVKKQTEGKIIDIMVNKAMRKIPEKEKILIFNRLIEDSNRRVEAKNRIQIVNQNNKIANELYDSESALKKKKKFDQRKFEDDYHENIINKLKERERHLELLRNKKIQDEKEKEDLIVKQMKSRNKKASQLEIDSISKRLYDEANNRKLKREMLRSFSEYEFEKRLNTISDMNKNTRNYSPFLNQNHFKSIEKKTNNSNSKNYYNFTTSNYNNNSINSSENNKNNFSNEPISYKKKLIDNMKKNINGYGNNSINKKSNKYVTYNNAEKMIDKFFVK